jgi:dolichol-phosphate mannosyltransferase
MANLRKGLRQASLRITLTPMGVVGRPAVPVVAPCFDEEDVLPLLRGRIGGVLDSLGGTIELVLVDDGSSDRTWEIIEKAAVDDSRVVGVRLMRKHGHQRALRDIVGGADIAVAATDPASPPLRSAVHLSA